MKTHGLRLEDSQIETADRLIKLAAIAAKAAAVTLQLLLAPAALYRARPLPRPAFARSPTSCSGWAMCRPSASCFARRQAWQTSMTRSAWNATRINSVS